MLLPTHKNWPYPPPLKKKNGHFVEKIFFFQNDFKYSFSMYSICDQVYRPTESSDLKINQKKNYLPNLILIGRSTAKKDIFKDGLVNEDSSVF